MEANVIDAKEEVGDEAKSGFFDVKAIGSMRSPKEKTYSIETHKVRTDTEHQQ